MFSSQFFRASAHHLLMALLALSFVLSACDKKSPHRNKPARKAGVRNATDERTQPNAKPGSPTSTDKASPTDPDRIPTKPEDATPDSADATNKEGANNNETDNKIPTSSNILSRSGSTQSGDSLTVDQTPRSDSKAITNRSRPERTGDSKNVPETKSASEKQNTEDQTIADLQKIFSQLHNIYLNAWYSVTKDRSSRPRNFFEDIATKMQNLKPILTLKEGDSTPSHIRNGCDKYRLVQTIDTSKDRRRLLLFDCQTQSYETLVFFNSTGNQWQLASTQRALDLLLPNQLGYLATITFKPLCTVTVSKDTDSVRITKALCREWGQELSAVRARDRKTIIFNSISYDISATNILETQAQYLDYDGSNQICRTGIMKRSAPQSNEVIYMDDEGDGQCHASPSDQGLPVVPVSPNPPAPQVPRALSPRVQAVPQTTTESTDNIDPAHSEMISVETPEQPSGEPIDNYDTNSDTMENSAPVDPLPEDPTADDGAISPESLVPPQAVPASPVDDGTQQMDFSSEAPVEPSQNNPDSEGAPQ